MEEQASQDVIADAQVNVTALGDSHDDFGATAYSKKCCRLKPLAIDIIGLTFACVCITLTVLGSIQADSQRLN